MCGTPPQSGRPRISWCLAERSPGEVGAGKTVSVRTCLDALDPCKHTVIHMPDP
ncbi:hypothetical protein ACIBVL_24910 [Streptomyces sp. NPDC049687]|uniref:hypothetical protein n=1 Tax=Streptomyces sp. NPDC049687 TaxID=3365596 RepID=UPI0037AA0406